ncbi:MAG: radical SAM protein [Candidatus Eisenbacteria bacterium]
MASECYPSYRKILSSGGFDDIITRADRKLAACDLCPRRCGVDRTAGELGFCKVGESLRVSSYGPHYGEESPLVGKHGSGTIFLAGCNLGCCFCQNYDISNQGEGRDVSAEDVSMMMLKLQETGCHNINFVTPTHFVPQIIRAVMIAAARGLSVPIVYNCGGYEEVGTLKLLENIVDIYMPDLKFSNPASSGKYCDAPDYPDFARTAVKEMHAQTGDLVVKNGLAHRGLLVRHLVMPGMLEESKQIFKFLATEISPETFVNVMNQYRPCYNAGRFPEIAGRLDRGEFRAVLDAAWEAGLKRIYY